MKRMVYSIPNKSRKMYDKNVFEQVCHAIWLYSLVFHNTPRIIYIYIFFTFLNRVWEVALTLVISPPPRPIVYLINMCSQSLIIYYHWVRRFSFICKTVYLIWIIFVTSGEPITNQNKKIKPEKWVFYK